MTEPSNQMTIQRRQVTRLDRIIQILEISFIFLLVFSLIALIDAVVDGLDLYTPISNDFLGRERVGPLNGGNYEAIVRITLVFNLLLFVFSLLFGIWIRRSRDNWTWAEFGYTFSTNEYSFLSLVRRGFILGVLAMIIFFFGRMLAFSLRGGDWTYLHAFAYFTDPDTLYTGQELQAEYYFGVVEMGFIWPLSAGFFFFAYTHNSLRTKFPEGVANIISTLFYVFYLQFFFLIDTQDKITRYWQVLSDPVGNYRFWIDSIALLIILFINFSAFSETKSIVFPFLMNFVFNVGITVVQASNALIFSSLDVGMLGIFAALFGVVIFWVIFLRQDFSTLKIGLNSLRGFGKIPVVDLIAYLLMFVFLSFVLPGVINEILFRSEGGDLVLADWAIPLLYALNFVLLLIMAILVLTYEPTDVWDVLLISKAGTPIASHIKLFETDEFLISGFFTALSNVDQELSADSGLKSIKRGQREILIEEGVFTQVIALADRDQSSIRNSLGQMHRAFEVKHGEKLQDISEQTQEAKDFVDQIGDLSIKFSIPDQTRWIGVLSLLLGPLMITLLGLL